MRIRLRFHNSFQRQDALYLVRKHKGSTVDELIRSILSDFDIEGASVDNVELYLDTFVISKWQALEILSSDEEVTYASRG